MLSQVYDKGGALLMTIVLLVAFVVIMISAVALVNRQFKETVNQEQEEQAFQIAEAGIQYSIWMLDQGLVDEETGLVVEGYEISDDRGEEEVLLGTFDVRLDCVSADCTVSPADFRIQSTGKDAVLTSATQSIEAIVRTEDFDDYFLLNWDHKP